MKDILYKERRVKVKKLIKSFVILCMVYVIWQGFYQKIVFAANDGNNSSSITYSNPDKTTSTQDQNSDDSSKDTNIDTQNKDDIDSNKDSSTLDIKSETSIYHDEDSSNSDTYSKSIAKKTTTSLFSLSDVVVFLAILLLYVSLFDESSS